MIFESQSRKTLNKYQQTYYAHQENEKRTAEKMRANNINLSNKIKSLESSLQTLDREHVELANNFISTKMELSQCRDENDELSQMVTDLRRDLETQSKEIESRLQSQMDDLIKSNNITLIEENNLLEDQLENLEIKVRYARRERE